jgi:UPF0716 protein FxsA
VALLLALLFLVVPIAELTVIILVGREVGVLETVALLILMSILGGWMVKRQGLGVLRRIQANLTAGRLPGADLVDGFLVLFAGALLLTPGFLTDMLALGLLLPPVRAVVRRVLGRRFGTQIVARGGVIDLP